ncbi:MAG TPA: recombinase family protein, partial [Candidatus Ruminococcus avistercoris]|nr:recombinase family protein [Candidatus Ruminococcus avistercoris]
RMQRMAENGEVGTIIVKDVSRFGREQVEMGRLTQVVYPSLGITFIAIQENINSTTGEGVEMLPFYSIFNEWYAAQTSKKIRAVNELKASQGRRVASAVAYGYKKLEGDKEQWYIDEPAAQVVRRIFALCLAGKGPMQIAKQLEKEKGLTPTAYFHSIGRKTSNPVPANIYGWHESTVERILENQQYTGCTVNGKSTTVSYKVHKVIENPKKEYQIIPNTQEAIIDENVWLRVQELRKNKRRPTKANRKSLFSGLVFCADCKSKLHFCAAKSLKRNQEFFRCANYKDGRGSCTIHFIRDVVLEMIVKEAVAGLADFVRCYESVFLYMQKRKCGEFQKKRQQELKLSVENSRKRIADLDKLFSRIYEDNVIGKLSDERYSRMAAEYEAEQKELLEKVREEEQQLSEMEQKSVDMRLLLQGLREFTDMKELTPTIVNKLIRRIEVHNPEKKHAHKSVKVDIYFTAVGLVSLPDEQEIRRMMEQMRSTSQLPKQLTA